MGPGAAVALVFVGCCSNVVSLELLVRSVTNTIVKARALKQSSDYALNFNIAMPFHMIFRSGSLIANMILGLIILKKRYSASKYLSIALVSAGIFNCTIMSAKQVSRVPSCKQLAEEHSFCCSSAFLSLIFSIMYFQNPFTGWHWVGTGVVFLGTLLYTEVWGSVRAALRGPHVKEKKAD
uniref:UDP-xylose and UDP-N-acetylglucosamine transporter-like n=1 Tax=Gasterosteus aculeatus aculeatus TaxID=481459 RepID=UPI001A99300A|nr:UDP-xylose and UDP-N-acetylglucosamine transporter-like [Gasterosteus aculeatus aculeatus]